MSPKSGTSPGAATPDPNAPNGTARAPANLLAEQEPDDGHIIDAELVDTKPATDPVDEMLADYPRGIVDALRRQANKLSREGFAKELPEALQRWRDRPDAKPGLLDFLVGDVVKERRLAANGQQSKIPPKASPAPAWQCPWCHDTGLVITSDGTPGSDPAACNHDNSRRPATSDDIAEYQRRRHS